MAEWRIEFGSSAMNSNFCKEWARAMQQGTVESVEMWGGSVVETSGQYFLDFLFFKRIILMWDPNF